MQELTVGGSDDSYIDLYQFEVSQSAQFEFSASSDTLDTVLLLATTELEYLAVETALPTIAIRPCPRLWRRVLTF